MTCTCATSTGSCDTGCRQTYQQVDGTEMGLFLWSHLGGGEPNEPNKHCVTLHVLYSLADFACDDVMPFVCERPAP